MTIMTAAKEQVAFNKQDTEIKNQMIFIQFEFRVNRS